MVTAAPAGLSSAKAQVTFFEVDGKVVATQQVARTVPLILQWDETFDTQQAKLPQSQEAKWSVWRYPSGGGRLACDLGL
jgi:hypothetical protein